MKIFIFIVHILTLAVLLMSGLFFFATGWTEVIIGLFKHDLLAVGIASLLCMTLSLVVFVITIAYLKESKWLRQFEYSRRQKHELIMSCGAAAVFLLELLVIRYFADFGLSELTFTWFAGLILNVTAAVLSRRK